MVITFLKYEKIANMMVNIPNPTDDNPIKSANKSPSGERLDLILKCKLVTKKPTPMMAIAVRIQARKVRSFAKCC